MVEMLLADDAIEGRGSSPRRIALAILQDLEEGRLVPGQRLIETDLVLQHGASRNAVREAMQILASRGVLSLLANRSPMIRRMDSRETQDVLAVAQSLNGLLAATAAQRFDPAAHGFRCDEIARALSGSAGSENPAPFNRARRQFYRTLLEIADNAELQRLFPAVGMDIIHIQHDSPAMRRLRREDYLTILAAVQAADAIAAEAAARRHVDNVRRLIGEREGQEAAAITKLR